VLLGGESKSEIFLRLENFSCVTAIVFWGGEIRKWKNVCDRGLRPGVLKRVMAKTRVFATDILDGVRPPCAKRIMYFGHLAGLERAYSREKLHLWHEGNFVLDSPEARNLQATDCFALPL